MEGRNISNAMASFTSEIPIKFPSLNDWTEICRKNKYAANTLKQHLEKKAAEYLDELPTFKDPIVIHFIWIEENNRRDYDNIAFAKKFILDALQKSGKLPNDNRKWVTGFSDEFTLGTHAGVVVNIKTAQEAQYATPHDAKVQKPEVMKSGAYKGQSEPVEAIDEQGILHHVFWDGKAWNELMEDGSVETYGAGLVSWRYLPQAWKYDSDWYTIITE